MDHTSEQAKGEGVPGAVELARLIRDHREDIVSRWIQANRVERRSWALTEEQLRDRIPLVVERIADLAGRPDGREAAAEVLAGPADTHALDRLDEGFNLEDLTEEYRLLRRCLLEVLAGLTPALPPSALATVDESIDRAVARSVMRFQTTRARALEALDQITEEGLGARSLEELLRGMLRVLVETVPSVDASTIFLREGDQLVSRATAGLTDQQGTLSMKVGEGFAGTVAARKQPLLSRSAATDPLVHNAVLRRSGVRALYGVPMLDAEGAVIGVAYMGSLTAYDFSDEDKLLLRMITHRAAAVIAQHLLREAAEERARQLRHAETLLSVHPDFFFLIDREHRFTWASPALLRLWGRTLEETVGRTFEELDYPRHLVELHREQLDQVLRGETIRYANPYTSPTGQEGIYEYVVVPVRGPDGAVEAVAGVTRDVSERHRAEQARADALARERAAREEAEKMVAALEALLAGSPAGIAFLDADLRYIRINDALAAVNGLPAKDHVGRRVREVIPTLADVLEPLLQRVLETGQPVLNVEVERAPPSTPDQVRAFLANYFPVRAPGGASVGLGAVVVEISDRKKMEQELRQAIQVRERLMGILGHDLRNPLAVVIAGASALLRSQALGERERRTVERITRNGERMARMIRDLLDYARASGGGLPIERRPADLRQIARQVVDDMRAAFPGREIHLQTDDAVRDGEWDPDRIAQLLSNLLSNALQYSPPESAVEVRVRAGGELAVLEVHNRGAPIPEDALPTLFEPFRRGAASEAASPGGLGLGLFIVRQIAHGHGGTVTARSTPGEGTTFTVSLPRCAPGGSPGSGG